MDIYHGMSVQICFGLGLYLASFVLLPVSFNFSRAFSVLVPLHHCMPICRVDLALLMTVVFILAPGSLGTGHATMRRNTQRTRLVAFLRFGPEIGAMKAVLLQARPQRFRATATDLLKPGRHTGG